MSKTDKDPMSFRAFKLGEISVQVMRGRIKLFLFYQSTDLGISRSPREGKPQPIQSSAINIFILALLINCLVQNSHSFRLISIISEIHMPYLIMQISFASNC